MAETYEVLTVWCSPDGTPDGPPRLLTEAQITADPRDGTEDITVNLECIHQGGQIRARSVVCPNGYSGANCTTKVTFSNPVPWEQALRGAWIATDPAGYDR